jgi:hypothetical protein
MSDYPELRDFLKGFTERYTSRTELGPELAVTNEELLTLSAFLVRGFVDWVGADGSIDDWDRPALGEFLEDFVDQYPHDGRFGAAMQVTDEEMIGLGMFLARSFVGWVLRLDQNRGRFKGFGDVIERKRLSVSGPISRRLIARAI